MARMLNSSAAVGTASAILGLSKEAWTLGISLSKLDQNTRLVDTTVRNLAGEVKSLGNQCDLVYAEVEGGLRRSEAGSPLPHDVDSRMSNCLAIQVEEASRTMQELELFVVNLTGQEARFIDQAQRQRWLDQSKNQVANIKTRVCRHRDNLHTTQLLINT